MISYESSKWYVKIWRQRWYLYAIFLHIKSYINTDIILDYIIDNDVSYEDYRKIKKQWLYIKRHVELTKMNKFTSNYKKNERKK